ncbi:MAG: tetratricopeptide repeat protein [Bacteroidota bacterium]
MSVFLLSCDSREVRMQQFLLKGNQHLEASEWGQAEYYYKQAIGLDSCYSDALNNLGTAYYRNRRWDEAIGWYDKAIACDPRPAYYLNRANAWYENNAFFNASADVDRVLTTRPDTVPALMLQGLILSKLQRYEEAIRSFDLALSKDSLDPILLVNRGTLLYYLRRYQEAGSNFNQALESDARSAEALNGLSMVSCETGDLAKAMELIGRALDISPRHPHYLNNRGYIHLLSGRLAEADADIQSSMVIDPDNPWVYRNRGISYLLKNDKASAERMFRQVLSSDSSVDKAAWYLVKSVYEQGRGADACKLLDIVPSIDAIPSEWRRACR